MTKRSREEFLGEFDELKTSIKIGRKMFKEAHKEEIDQLKKMEKILKIGLKGKAVVTEDYLSIGLLSMTKQLHRMINTQHMYTHTMLGNVEKTLESVLMINGIVEILGDFAKETKLKSAQAKIRKIQKFQNYIINHVKENKKSKPNLTNAYTGVL